MSEAGAGGGILRGRSLDGREEVWSGWFGRGETWGELLFK